MTIYVIVRIHIGPSDVVQTTEYYGVGPAYKFKSLAEIEAVRLDGVFSVEGFKSVHHEVVPVELVE